MFSSRRESKLKSQQERAQCSNSIETCDMRYDSARTIKYIFIFIYYIRTTQCFYPRVDNFLYPVIPVYSCYLCNALIVRAACTNLLSVLLTIKYTQRLNIKKMFEKNFKYLHFLICSFVSI